MMNYEIFTHIYVLQGFNAKEAKKSGKSSKKMAKAGKWKISLHNFTMSRQDPEATCKSFCNKQKCVTIKTKQSAR